MMGAVTQTESIVVRLGGKERLHAFHLKLHFDIGGQLGCQLFHRIKSLLLRV